MTINKRWGIDVFLLIVAVGVLHHLLSMVRGPMDQLAVSFSGLCIGFAAGYHSDKIADLIFGKEDQ